MGKLSMSQEEYEYYVSTLSEGFSLMGQDTLLYQVKTCDKDLYSSDIKSTYEEPVKISILFEENPKPVLKLMNWLEDIKDSSYIIYVPTKTEDGNMLKITEKSIFKITSQYGLYASKSFIANKVQGNTIDPTLWICQVSPYIKNNTSLIKEEGIKISTYEKTDDLERFFNDYN